MISLKKYLDQDLPGTPPPEPPREPSGAAMECYRAALLAMGQSAAQCCPGPGQNLERSLEGLEHRVAADPSDPTLRWVQKQVEIQLQEWGARTADHFKARADEVKELLLALAKTAESVDDRTQGQTSQFRQVTVRLESLADLNDLATIRISLVQRVNELKDSVDRMTRDNEHMVAQLKAEVTKYETRLREVENLVMKDDLTGVANRRSVEERIRWHIANGQTFCVVMLDLNGFKQINDRHGHPAGDALLRQFAGELQTITRTGDLVGRWGGDEFVVLLACDAQGARLHTDRIREWVFGKYTLDKSSRQKPLEVAVDAAVGLAEWHPGDSPERVIAAADAAMYQNKNQLAGV
ncbi:MAG: GGDEF domain-containing protein [Acidobacteriaceae bacterium]